MKINEIVVVQEHLDDSMLYKAAEQAFEILSEAKRSLGRPTTLTQDDLLHRQILNYLGL